MANMRISDKLSIIDKIGRELQSRYTYAEIGAYLTEFGVDTPRNIHVNSKWVYSKTALQGVPMSTISKIAEDLELGSVASIAASPPAHWKDTNQFRLFIGHIAKHKDKATRLKSCLEPFAISGFVAHEDIEPTLEWQREIERALHYMDAFVAIHTPGFSASNWTQQEIGFAVGRGVKIISLKMGEDPTGFISRRQALPRQRKTAEEVAKEIDDLLSIDDLTSERLRAVRQLSGLQQNDDEIPF